MSSSHSEDPVGVTIANLPDFIIEEIFEQFEKIELLALSSVCSQWRRLIVPLYWRCFEGNAINQLLKKPHFSLLKERGSFLRHLEVALKFSTWEYSDWEITLTYCPYLVSGSFEVRTSHELKKLFLAASTLLPHLTKLSLFIKFDLFSWPVDPLILLDSIEELYVDFAYHLEHIECGFFSPLKGNRLKKLTLVIGNKADLRFITEIQNNFPSLTHFSVSGAFYSSSKDSLSSFNFKHLRSLKLYSTNFAFDFDPSFFFGLPDSLPNLTCLEMDSGRRSLKLVQHYVMGNYWKNIKNIACDVGHRISTAQLYNMRFVTHLNLRFATKKDASCGIPKILANLKLLTHLTFKGVIVDNAFKNAVLPSNFIRKITIDGIHSLSGYFIAWLISLNYLQKMILVGIYDEPPFVFTLDDLPVDVNFSYLLYAKFPMAATHFSRWIKQCSPDLTYFTQMKDYD